MNFIYIGEIVNTHGIKGEVRILSDFKYKKDVFKKNMKIYIGKEKNEYVINTYRFHKIFDMITFIGINDINDVIDLKSEKVYVNKEDIKIDGYLDEDIIGLEAYTDKYIGKVTDIIHNKNQDILVIKNKNNKNLVPHVDEFIEKIDLENSKIYIKEIEGLINED